MGAQWLLGLSLLSLLALPAGAEPVAVVVNSGVTVTLTDEPCQIEAVKNLQYRATWVERGGSFEGCFTVQSGIVVLYWSDKTVVILPGRAFKKAGAT